eukprot:TRINITY_DN31986_c0_g1_i1.p1 TRINITY_DN31986_c0_g1~~TRINITY_DN31986_c0_g1_i1.p1  ORF type:complete len:715 (+),score=130.73 TRINITY_DN31986_c0_g1_i1:324-2147(+)
MANTTAIHDQDREIRWTSWQEVQEVAEDLAESKLSDNSSALRGLRTLLAEPGKVDATMADWRSLTSALASIRPTDLKSIQKKIGPSYAFPARHVAGRRSVDWSEGARMQQEMGDPFMPREPAFESYDSFEAAWDEWTMLCIFGLGLVMLGSVMSADRRNQQQEEGSKSLLLELETRWKLTGSDAAGGKLTWLRAAVQAQQQQEEQVVVKPEGLSVWDSTVACFSTIVGTGLLAMPYAFSLAGMVAVPLTIFFVSCSAYTAHLMVWSMKAEAARNCIPSGRLSAQDVGCDWGSLAKAAFGTRAKYAMDIFLVLELWGYLLSTIVCSAMNVAQLFESLDVSSSIGLSVLGCYSLTFVPQKSLTKVNVMSNLFFIVCCVMFLVTGLMLPTKAPPSDVEMVKPHGVLAAAGILVFSPAGHSFYPRLIQQMEEPSKFPCSIRRAYFAACICYLAVAVPGYYLFGNATQPSAIRNIGFDLHLNPLPNFGWMNTAAALGMVLKLVPMQALVLSPLTAVVKGFLPVSCDSGISQNFLTPSLLLVSAIAAARFANEMATLLNLIGSIFCMNISFVMPVICYWRLAPEPLSFAKRAVLVFLVLVGITFAVLGVVSSF